MPMIIGKGATIGSPAIGMAIAAGFLCPPPAQAGESDAPLRWRLTSSTDGWAAVGNGRRRNTTALSKFDAGLTLDGRAAGMDWLTAHASYFHVIGHGPSERLIGDGHGIDNNESDPDHRLFEAWIDARLTRNASMRFGLMDLNAQFDAIEPASLFINGGHGMGTEFAVSGVNGPSTYPATGLGISGQVRLSRLTLQAAAIDGAPADLSGTASLASLRLSRREGALIVGQARYAPRENGPSIGLGVYRYSRAPITRPGDTARRQGGGIYAMAEVPMAGGFAAWARIGFAGAAISDVRHQISGGVAGPSPFSGRDDDALGLAVSTITTRAAGPGQIGHARTETNIELTYRLALGERIALQPDLQYVIRPAYDRDLDSVLLTGLRVTIAFGN